ncbi:MAG: hypothetical protein KJ052_15900 [Candidatus Hydrogenedentes bacterium]|nr:hypothetical protein [Candidatus Hydrogenedentota bacterium]
MIRPSQPLYWLLLCSLVVCSVGYAYFRDFHGQSDIYRKGEADVERLRRELSDLKDDEAALRRSVEHLKSDPVEIEATLRRNKRVGREGERYFRITLDEEAGSGAPHGD